jgi:hypothetical protein
LTELLLWLASGSAGPALYVLLERWEWFQVQFPDVKRWLAMGISAAIAVAAWGIGVALGVFEIPAGGWQDVALKIGDIIVLAVVVFSGSQLAHTKTLRARR